MIEDKHWPRLVENLVLENIVLRIFDVFLPLRLNASKTSFFFQDCMEGIQNWMKQYDEEIELRDYDILQMRADLEKTADELQVIEDKYKTQVEEIKNWMEYKRIKKEKDDHDKLILWATIKIQVRKHH